MINKTKTGCEKGQLAQKEKVPLEQGDDLWLGPGNSLLGAVLYNWAASLPFPLAARSTSLPAVRVKYVFRYWPKVPCGGRGAKLHLAEDRGIAKRKGTRDRQS